MRVSEKRRLTQKELFCIAQNQLATSEVVKEKIYPNRTQLLKNVFELGKLTQN